jgi:hypothetical protein
MSKIEKEEKEKRQRKRPRKKRPRKSPRKKNHGTNVRVPSQIAVIRHHRQFLRGKCPTTCHQRKMRNQRMSGIVPTVEAHPVISFYGRMGWNAT